MNRYASRTSTLVRTRSVRQADPGNWDTIKQVLDHGKGYVVLRGFPVSNRPEADICADFEALMSRLGTVTEHGASGQKIWRIAPRPELDHVPTFSEAAGEAPFHTDNSWVPEPERYFALLVIRPADVGGESLACPVAELLDDFARTREGAAAVRTLSENVFPFAMPVVFRDNAERAASVTPVFPSRVILSRSAIRYRYDVLKTGFQVRPDLATPENVRALEVFNEFLTGVRQMYPTIRLENGDLLIANNFTVLHARTDFADPKRLLLRARIALPKNRN
jgi:alpha-ketoglutarate-dependent taurine dioxygenase